jgi:hypothetical protein
MKNFWIIVFFTLVTIIPFTIQQGNSLIQYGAEIRMEISPGETKTFEWQLKASEGDSDIELAIGSRGWGSQFFSYPDSLFIPEGEVGTVEVSVTIPSDHPGGVVLGEDHQLRLTATQFGEPGGSTLINIRASKIIILDVLQNENPEYWSNTAYDEPAKPAEQVTMEKPAEETPVEEKQPAAPFSISQPTQTEQAESQEEGGGCLISTATFGTELAPQVQLLREIRDKDLLTTSSGSSFMSGFNTLYYSFSPAVADLERQSPMFREAVKITITPLIASLSLLNYVDMDSEAQVLGYGISLILLNAGMYFVAPAIVISKLKKRF